MVNTTTVKESNARYAGEHHKGLVCVFAGGTAGIGAATLERLTSMLQSSNFYILGRNPPLSVIADIDSACSQICSAEEKVDVMCMSPGGMPFAGAKYTSEGLEQCFATSYYSRLRMVSNLLPLLHQSRQPHVLSILNSTKETTLNEDDINLDKQWGIRAVVNHTTLLTSLAFDYLSEHDGQKHIVFLHATPGFVNTNTTRTEERLPSKKDGLLWWAFLSIMQVISGWVIRYFGMDVKESGERHAFHLTSDTFQPGSWRVDSHSDVVPDNDTLQDYQDRGWAERVWDFTHQVWDKAVAAESTTRSSVASAT